MAKKDILGYDNKVIANWMIDEDEEIEHKKPFGCGWSGTIKECAEEAIGRRGHGPADAYRYMCPQCKRLIKVHTLVYWD